MKRRRKKNLTKKVTDNEESDSGDNDKDNKDSIEEETVSTSETKSESPIPEHTEL